MLIKYILFISFLRGGQICYLLRLPDKKKSNGGGGLVDWVAASGEKKWKKKKDKAPKKGVDKLNISQNKRLASTVVVVIVVIVVVVIVIVAIEISATTKFH